ncbi:MAG TPA: class F sortase [Dehalococcoidia bacterium]|nr:class F sortase [Dehalococcoidia bacterium]
MNKVRRLLPALVFILAGVGFTAAYFLMPASGESQQPRANLNWQVPFVVETASPTVATQAPDARTIRRLILPSVGIDAPVVIGNVDDDGRMQAPSGPTEVAWYGFSAHPGATGNVVMAAHVDYIDYGPAAFWRLRDVKAGDEVTVTLDDGASFVYRIVSSIYYDAEDAPVAEIVGPTPNQTITLITCGGVFDKSVREYDQRLVVRGVRVTSVSNPGL